MKIFIKNMVCNRCISAVEGVFNELAIPTTEIVLGEVDTENPVSEKDLKSISTNLENLGFEILESQTKKQIEKTKNLIVQKISELDISEDFILSEFLSRKMHRDYSSISKTFSQNENMTLEHYFILQKIEKVKELLIYGEWQLTEIAGKLGYKTVQHLSSQFKNVTGFTPTQFKNLKDKRRKPLDEI